MKPSILEYTEYTTPDGEIYKFDNSSGRWLMTEDGLGIPPIEYITQKSPDQHGETPLGYRFGSRIVQLQINNKSVDRGLYWTERAKILEILNPDRQILNGFSTGTLTKHFSDGTSKALHVFVQQGPSFVSRQLKSWQETTFAETIRFVAHDPIAFNPTEKIAPFTAVDYGTYMRYLFTIDYPGTFPAYPTIRVNGPFTRVKITHQTTYQKIDLVYTTTNLHYLLISLNPGNKTVTLDGSTNLLGSVTTDSDLTEFHIAHLPEVSNGANYIEMEIYGHGVGTLASIRYYENYIGF